MNKDTPPISIHELVGYMNTHTRLNAWCEYLNVFKDDYTKKSKK